MNQKRRPIRTKPVKNHTRLRSHQLTASGKSMETTRHGSGNAAPYFLPMNPAVSDVSAFIAGKKTVCH
jgi:hypothetical protein